MTALVPDTVTRFSPERDGRRIDRSIGALLVVAAARRPTDFAHSRRTRWTPPKEETCRF